MNCITCSKKAEEFGQEHEEDFCYEGVASNHYDGSRTLLITSEKLKSHLGPIQEILSAIEDLNPSLGLSTKIADFEKRFEGCQIKFSMFESKIAEAEKEKEYRTFINIFEDVAKFRKEEIEPLFALASDIFLMSKFCVETKIKKFTKEEKESEPANTSTGLSSNMAEGFNLLVRPPS